jgi:tetratricopeptide (TPR) repeat protein
MKKISLIMLSFLIFIVSAMAQNVDEGKRQLYYQKYVTAKQTLQNAVNANSKDPNAVYWLGQALLAQDDIAGAKALYQKALNEIGNSDPLIMVGVGHVELLEGKRDAARQRFETAISLSMQKRNPNPAILNAIGRANADGPTSVGDPVYAVEKLIKAAELDKTNPDILINLGVNYLKMGSERGGEAVQAFNSALQRDPRNALALYRIGRIYESQQNKELFEDYYNRAIAADPAFSPTYFVLYDYYKSRDVNKALGYLQNFIKYAEPNPENDFYMAEYLFRAGKYQESLNQAKALETKFGLNVLPRLNVLYAYNYDRLGDSIKAKASIEKYFASAKEDKVQPTDYVFAGTILAKFPGSEDAASMYLEKAIKYDTIRANKIDYMNTAADLFGRAQKYEQQYQWLAKLANFRGQWSEADHYRLNDVSYKAKSYQRVLDTLGPKYIVAFPDKPQGYSFRVRAAKAIDTSGTLGLAVEPINQQNEYFIKDTAKNKKSIYSNYYYLLIYYNDKAKDVDKAIEMTEKMMALYPAGSEEHNFAKTTNEALVKNKNRGKSGGGTNTPKGNANATTGSGSTTTQKSGANANVNKASTNKK